MNPRSWRDVPKWGASSLAWHSCQVKPCQWVCGESLCEVKITGFCNKILNFSSIPCTLGFSHGGVRDNMTHCMHLKRELQLLLWLDYLPSHLTRILHFSFSLLRSWDITRKGEREDTEGQSCKVSKWKTSRICGATRRMFACEWHIKVNCDDELMNYPCNFLSFGRLQAWIHAIKLWRNTLDSNSKKKN